MRLFHFVGYGFKDEKEYDDESNKMSPYVDGLVVYHEKRLNGCLGRFKPYPISFVYMLIIFGKIRCFLESSKVSGRTLACRVSLFS